MKEKEVMDIFSAYIKSRNLRDTQQREEIVQLFFKTKKHITAEELYMELKKKNPDIGFATVHRTLKLLAECDLANEVKIGGGKTRYEQKFGHDHHDHLICLKCGRFIEVKDEKIEQLQDKLAKANNFTPKRHKLEIYGLCKNCS